MGGRLDMINEEIDIRRWDRLRLLATGILEFLAGQSVPVSEAGTKKKGQYAEWRQALAILVALKVVRQHGSGERHDPFLYSINRKNLKYILKRPPRNNEHPDL